jgi:hypothetical protein
MGKMTKLLSGAVLAGGVLAAGCHHAGGHGGKDREWHGDPCWPDRYSNEARKLQVASFEPQVLNGHILDQTIWNQHFEAGTDKLNAAGMDKLDQLARRRPAPDTRVFLQTARDLAYNPEKPGDYSTKRSELDVKRASAIKQYLETSLTGRPSKFEVEVHDPAMPGIDGAAPRLIVPSPRVRAAGTGAGVGPAQPPAAPADPNAGYAPPPSSPSGRP